MWTVPTKSLVMRDGEPEKLVDVVFPKPATAGAIIDEETGFLYATDVQHSAIWVTNPTVRKAQS